MEFSAEFWNSSQIVIETLFFVILSGVLVSGGAAAHQWLQDRISVEKYNLTLSLIRAAVLATEQVGLHDQSSEKLQRAVDYAHNLLTEHGIQLNIQRIVELIESVVYDELNRWQTIELADPPTSP